MAATGHHAGATVAVLLELWHGDDDCAGYQHPEIAAALCERVDTPVTVDAVKRLLYPPSMRRTADEDAVAIIRDGFHVWEQRGRPHAD